MSAVPPVDRVRQGGSAVRSAPGWPVRRKGGDNRLERDASAATAQARTAVQSRGPHVAVSPTVGVAEDAGAELQADPRVLRAESARTAYCTVATGRLPRWFGRVFCCSLSPECRGGALLVAPLFTIFDPGRR